MTNDEKKYLLPLERSKPMSDLCWNEIQSRILAWIFATLIQNILRSFGAAFAPRRSFFCRGDIWIQSLSNESVGSNKSISPTMVKFTYLTVAALATMATGRRLNSHNVSSPQCSLLAMDRRTFSILTTLLLSANNVTAGQWDRCRRRCGWSVQCDSQVSRLWRGYLGAALVARRCDWRNPSYSLWQQPGKECYPRDWRWNGLG